MKGESENLNNSNLNLILDINKKPKENDLENITYMKNFNIYDVNCTALNCTTDELYNIIFLVFKEKDLMNQYQISTSFFCEFIWTLEYFYNKAENPFHNFKHGVEGKF